jgi:nucleotide-binding universal stress UspA family protein
MRALIATDGTDASLAAATWCQTNLPVDAQFTVVSVAPLPEDPNADAGGIEGPLLDADSADEIEHEALQHAGDSASATGELLAPHPVEQRVVRGEAGSAVVDIADEVDADLVVVGSHRPGMLTRVFLGSVSDYVVHHSKRPVLVVPLPE